MIEWSIIPGFNGRYRVSNAGHVQSTHVLRAPRGTIGPWWDMAQPLDARGYPLVYLFDQNGEDRNKRRIRALVHQLVARAFVPAVKGKPFVNHIDGNPGNKHYANLEWCTQKENMVHAWRTGLCKPHKLSEKVVREILTCGGTDTAVGLKYGVSQVFVSKIRRREAWAWVTP